MVKPQLNNRLQPVGDSTVIHLQNEPKNIENAQELTDILKLF